MGIGELVGGSCESCKRIWQSTADFKRLEIYSGPYCTNTSPLIPDIPPAIMDASFWRVKCELCGHEQRIVWEAS